MFTFKLVFKQNSKNQLDIKLLMKDLKFKDLEEAVHEKTTKS